MSIPTKPKNSKKNPGLPTKAEIDADYKVWRGLVGEELQARGHDKAADNWDYCDSTPRYRLDRNNPEIPIDTKSIFVCSTNHTHDAVLFAVTCDNRVCPDCASKHSARMINRYVKAVGKLIKEYPQHRLRMITLTRSVDMQDAGFREIAQEGFLLVKKALRKVIGKGFLKNGAGMLVNWEIGPKGKKLHYHVVYFGGWVDQRKLSAAWKVLTQGDYVVWVKGVKQNDGDWEKSVVYTLKYATKFYSTDKATGERIYLSPAVTVDLYEALKGTRRIRSYGSLFRLGDDDKRKFVCNDCDAPMVRIPVSHFLVWFETGYDEIEWKNLTRDSLLNLSIADKSGKLVGKHKQRDRVQVTMLPGFEEKRSGKPGHYTYE